MLKKTITLLLFCICFLLSFSINAQNVSEFENIIIEINDGSTSLYDCIGRRIVVDEFAPGFVPPSSFTGSCGYSEQGIPFYSQQVDADAWILPMEGCFPDDFPEKIGGYTYNRPGHSSFLAFKNWGTDSQKVWINLTIGAWKYAYPNPYEKEYQIRYFSDRDLAIDSMIILTVPGSGYCTSIEKIENYNVQISAKGWIKGKVETAKINRYNGTIDRDPINAEVRLHETGNPVYIENVIAENGLFSFDTVDTNKSYYITALYDTTDKFGNLINTLVKVDALYSDTLVDVMHNAAAYVHFTEVLDSMKTNNMQVGLFDGGIYLPITYEYNTAGAEAILDNYDFLDEDYRDKISTLMRHSMSYMAVQDYLESSHLLCEEGMNSISEMVKLPLNLVISNTKFDSDKSSSSSVPDDVDIATSALSCIIGTCTRVIKDMADKITSVINTDKATEVNNAIKTICVGIETSSLNNGLYLGNGNWLSLMNDILGEIVILGGTKGLNDLYYVEEYSQNILNMADDDANYDSPYGEDILSVQKTISKSLAHNSYVYNDSISSKTAKDIAYDHRYWGRYDLVLADWAGFASDVSKYLAAPTEGASLALVPVFSSLEYLLQGSAFIRFTLGAAESFDRWADLEAELINCNTYSFYQKNTTYHVKTYSSKDLNQKVISINNSIQDFNLLAQQMAQFVNNNDSSALYSSVDSLIDLHESINDNVQDQLYMVYNVVNVNSDSLGSFESFYDSYTENILNHTFQRLKFMMDVASYIGDTINSGVSYGDSITATYSQLINEDSILSDAIGNMNDSLSIKSASAFIVPKAVNMPDSVCGGTWFELNAYIKNYGTTDAQNVNIKLSIPEYFNVDIDSIHAGNIAVGDSFSYTFNIGVPNMDTTGYVGMLFYSDNAGQITDGKIVEVNHRSNSIVLDANITNISCNGNSDGSIDLNVSGGSGAFTYSWDSSFSGTNINNLGVGNYIVTISDTNSCSYIKHFQISQADSLSIISSSEPTTTNGSDGKAIVVVSGGTPPYSFQWNDNLSQTTDTASNLATGTYECIITDSLGCSITDSIQVDTYTELHSILIQKVELYPNPSDGYVYLKLELPKQDDVDLRVYDNIGKEVFSISFKSISRINQPLDLRQLGQGVYTVSIEVDKHISFNKISLINR